MNLQEFKNYMAKQFSGLTKDEAIEIGKCVTCGNKAGMFKDALSKKEYYISGICQKCQDEVFNAD